MATVQKGSPIVFGIGAGPAKLIQFETGSERSVFLQNVQLSIASNSQEIQDGNGEVTGKVFFDKRKTLTASMYMTASSEAAAETSFIETASPGDEVIMEYDEFAEIASDVAATELTGAPTSGTGKFVLDTIDRTRTAGNIAELSFTATEYVADLT
jgi:hypothetical protein